MPVKITNYINVKEKTTEIGCELPHGVVLLPSNFELAKSKTELNHEILLLNDADRKIQKILFNDNYPKKLLVRLLRKCLPVIGANAAGFGLLNDNFFWIGPTLFISSSILIQNPNAISISINIISSYLMDLFKTNLRYKKPSGVHLNIVVEIDENKKTYKKYEYHGDVEGLKELQKILQEVEKDSK